MKESPAPNLTDRIARRVRDLRAERGLSLDDLAQHCGVSRSMISLIERGESSPTAVILEKLATGLNVSLASLFDAPAAPPNPLSRLADQMSWRDPESGYVRRNVSPSGVASPIQIVEVSFPRARASRTKPARATRASTSRYGCSTGRSISPSAPSGHRLRTGDCLAMVLDRPLTFHNPTRKAARYAVVLSTEAVPRR
jgi:transcriptional regulator with XRE-family HTH domain